MYLFWCIISRYGYLLGHTNVQLVTAPQFMAQIDRPQAYTHFLAFTLWSSLPGRVTTSRERAICLLNTPSRCGRSLLSSKPCVSSLELNGTRRWWVDVISSHPLRGGNPQVTTTWPPSGCCSRTAFDRVSGVWLMILRCTQKECFKEAVVTVIHVFWRLLCRSYEIGVWSTQGLSPSYKAMCEM